MALGKGLKQLLEEKSITVKDFADSIDVAPTTLYSFIKRDSPTGRLELIAKIAKGLDMRIDEFMTFDDEESNAVDQTMLEEWQQLLDTKEDVRKDSRDFFKQLLDMLKELVIENDNANIFTELPEEDLLYYFWNMNEEGQRKTIDYAKDICSSPKYRKDSDTPEVNVAHRSKGAFTEEERQTDEDMLD